jgi:hypothetical protein
MNLSDQQIVTLARNSFDACFSTQEQRNRWNAELDTATAQHAESGASKGRRPRRSPTTHPASRTGREAHL